MKIRRAGTYRTRHMQAWTVTDVLGRVLLNAGTHEEIKEDTATSGHAEYTPVTVRSQTAPSDDEGRLTPQPTVCARAAVDDLSVLRADAELMGIHVDMRWGVDRLRKEIANRHSLNKIKE